MPDRADTFLTTMVAIAIIGILAYAVFLIGRAFSRPQKAVAGGARDLVGERPQWVEYILALVLLAVATGVAVWQLVGERLSWSGPGDDRALIFFIIMAVAAVLGLLGFLIFLGMQAAQRRTQEQRAAAVLGDAATAPADAAAAMHESPSALRLLGLLLFAVGFLVINWVYVAPPMQHAVMLYILYPASVAVLLVLLFDKATRVWSTKSRAESFREWLFCDVLALLLILGFFNLLGDGAAESYAALFWDVLFICLTVLAFWLVDRQQTPYRFLVGAGYFVLLPILVLIWRAVQDVAVPADLSWWSSIWPFFILAIVFFALDVVMLLIPGTRERQGIPALKDVVFYVLYAILLISAIPEAAA